MKNIKILCLYLTVVLAAICVMALSSKAAEQPISGTFSVLVSASHSVDGGPMQMQTQTTTGFPCCAMRPGGPFYLGAFSVTDMIENGRAYFLPYYCSFFKQQSLMLRLPQ